MAKTDDRNDGKYELRLYVNGMNGRSRQAVANLREILDEYLPEQFDLTVVDIREDPEGLERDQILATPTLVKYLPNPISRLVGDLSNADAVLAGMDISPA